MAQQTQIVAGRAGTGGRGWPVSRRSRRWPPRRRPTCSAPGQGLGYDRRALNLLRCARAVVAEHGGALPVRRSPSLERLPGLGPYTARAVAATRLRPARRRRRRQRPAGRRAASSAGRTDPGRWAPARLQAAADELVPADEPGRLDPRPHGPRRRRSAGSATPRCAGVPGPPVVCRRGGVGVRCSRAARVAGPSRRRRTAGRRASGPLRSRRPGDGCAAGSSTGCATVDGDGWVTFDGPLGEHDAGAGRGGPSGARGGGHGRARADEATAADPSAAGPGPRSPRSPAGAVGLRR